MNKKTSFGVPVLLAAVLGLSACVPTTELESSEPTTQEQAVEAGETGGGEDSTAAEGAEVTDEPAVESENSGETSTETDSEDVAQDTDDAMSEEEETPTEPEPDSESEPEPETVDESETTDQAVVDNTPTKIEAPQCFKDKVNDRGEIKFAPGTSSGTVNQSVLRDEADLYRFDANEGQKWALTLSSLEDNAIFNLYAPTTGSITTQNDLGSLNGILEESGTYEICVLSSARNATYELVLSIDG